MNEQLSVAYKGRMIQLNPALVVEQCMTPDEVNELLYWHFQRMVVVDTMKCTNPFFERVLIDRHITAITEIDYILQNIWGFDLDARYHRWWELPHCICPDNECNLGTDLMTINTKCPIHGEFDE